MPNLNLDEQINNLSKQFSSIEEEKRQQLNIMKEEKNQVIKEKIEIENKKQIELSSLSNNNNQSIIKFNNKEVCVNKSEKMDNMKIINEDGKKKIIFLKDKKNPNIKLNKTK